MSDTPRTDAAEWMDECGVRCTNADFARQLETDLIATTHGAKILAVERQQLTADLATMRAELDKAYLSINSWTETAAEYARGLSFYRDLIIKIGDPFWVAAKTSDDGSIQEDVLALRVPELVESMRAERDAARTDSEIVEYLESYWPQYVAIARRNISPSSFFAVDPSPSSTVSQGQG